MKPLILIIDDEARYRELYRDTLTRSGFEVLTAISAEEAERLLTSRRPAMIVSDARMPGKDGLTFLREIRTTLPELPFLLITAYAKARDAVQALKLGAVDYLEKPVDLDELVTAVHDALGIPVQEGDMAAAPPATLMKDIIAVSPSVRAIFADAWRVAQSDATALITGESGVGKEVLARFIHGAGPRARGPFVAVNCAAVPEHTLAAELFGHVKGAFTGAIADRDGLFRAANKGSFFLDEIGDMPLKLQPALLRAIETGTVTPVGSDREIRVDTRLIASTNKNLEEEVAAGRFRQDLFYRLNVIAFEIPPLRERREDILPLARRFLGRGGANKRLSPAAADILTRYRWPGNIRELANALARAGLLSNTEIILPEHFPPAVRPVETDTIAIPPADPSVKTMDQVEEDAIRAALKETDGNRTRAAQLLGISRRALIYKLKRL